MLINFYTRPILSLFIGRGQLISEKIFKWVICIFISLLMEDKLSHLFGSFIDLWYINTPNSVCQHYQIKIIKLL